MQQDFMNTLIRCSNFKMTEVEDFLMEMEELFEEAKQVNNGRIKFDPFLFYLWRLNQ